jgi:capsular polysaccharide export protein
MADAASFQAMITAALIENPDCQVLLKVHPDVFTHRKRGWLPTDPQWPDPDWNGRVTVIGSDCHAVRLLRHARAVYAVTSLMGFEALMWGKPVRCFGMPFYGGWGLTVDELPPLARRPQVGIEALVHAVLVECSRYVDPASGRRWQVEEAIAHVAAGRRALLGDAVEAAFD